MSVIVAFDTSTPTASVALLEWTNGRAVRGLDGLSGQVLARRDQPVSTHGKALVPLIQDVLGEAQVSPERIDAVVCGAGPGSFTGVRVGLATAKGLCFALNIPLVLPRSLDAVAARAMGPVFGSGPESTRNFGKGGAGDAAHRRVVACMDARRGEVYVAGWTGVFGLKAMAEAGPGRWLEDRAVRPDDLAQVIVEHLTRQGASGLVGGDGASAGDAASLIFLGTGLDLIRSSVERIRDDVGMSVVLRDDLDPWPDAVALAGIGGLMLDEGRVADLDGAQPIYLRPSDAEAKFGLALSPKGGQQ